MKNVWLDQQGKIGDVQEKQYRAKYRSLGTPYHQVNAVIVQTKQNASTWEAAVKAANDGREAGLAATLTCQFSVVAYELFSTPKRKSVMHVDCLYISLHFTT